MSENSSTRTLRTHLVSRGFHVQRIEDKLSPGIPDTNGCQSGIEVWLEGKHLKQLPARGTTLARFGNKGEDRLTHQRNWLESRRKAGGLAFWWLRVRDGDGAGWYLFPDKFNWLTDGVEKRVLMEQERFDSAKAMVRKLESYIEKQTDGFQYV